jgi:hypothetical protein
MGFKNSRQRSEEKLTEYDGIIVGLKSLEDYVTLEDVALPDGTVQDVKPLRAEWITYMTGTVSNMGETLVFSKILQEQVRESHPEWAVGYLRKNVQKRDETRTYWTLDPLSAQEWEQFLAASELEGIE